MATKTKHLNCGFFYTHLKKHSCPVCSCLLRARRAEKTVSPPSDDGLYFDKVRLVFCEFVCDGCKRRFSVDEIRQYEGTLRREKRK